MSHRFGPRTRTSSSAVLQWGRSPVIGVQRGTIAITGATSNTATIAAVNLNNAVIRYLGQTYTAAATEQNKAFARVELTNATTVTASVNTSPGAETTSVDFEVTEYLPGVIKSVQRGTVVGAATAAITAVDMTKSDLHYLGHTESAADGITQYLPRLSLSTATLITQSVVVSAATTSGYQVVEWN